jgi:hypothetical protein
VNRFIDACPRHGFAVERCLADAADQTEGKGRIVSGLDGAAIKAASDLSPGNGTIAHKA